MVFGYVIFFVFCKFLMVVLVKFLDVIMKWVLFGFVLLVEVSFGLLCWKWLERLFNIRESVFLYLYGKYVIGCY